MAKLCTWNSSSIFKKAANAQDAHEAIRPTSALRDPETVKPFMSRDQFRLYKLVWERFMASQMASAIMDTLSVDIEAGETIFRAAGSKVRFPGFMKVYVEGNDDGKTEEDKLLPPLQPGDKLKKKRLSRSSILHNRLPVIRKRDWWRRWKNWV